MYGAMKERPPGEKLVSLRIYGEGLESEIHDQGNCIIAHEHFLQA